MILRLHSLPARLILRLPMWLPIYVEAARVGTDCRTFVRFGVRW